MHIAVYLNQKESFPFPHNLHKLKGDERLRSTCSRALPRSTFSSRRCKRSPASRCPVWRVLYRGAPRAGPSSDRRSHGIRLAFELVLGHWRHSAAHEYCSHQASGLAASQRRSALAADLRSLASGVQRPLQRSQKTSFSLHACFR